MARLRPFFAALALASISLSASPPAQAQTMPEILARAPESAWRTIDPDRLAVLETLRGPVFIELAPDFAPAHVANIKLLIAQGYFDGLSINRVHDNYVVQWGDPQEPSTRPLGAAAEALAPEFDRAIRTSAFTPLPDGDVYAAEVGHRDGFPVARDPKTGREWLAHCYGMVGVGRGEDPASGSGAELYAVIGHAPRNLDRNVTLVGRVVSGMALLSGLPRGTDGPLGLYATPAERAPIRMRMAGPGDPVFQALRTEGETFDALIESRRNRRDAWYARPAGAIDVCAVPLPVRTAGN